MWKLVPQLARLRARRANRKILSIVRRVEPLEPRQLLTGYVQTDLVADQAGAALLQDPNLVNPWGVVVGAASGNFVVASNGSATATQYAGLVGGSAFSAAAPTISVPGGFPTADVINTTTDFNITNSSGGSSGPAAYIFAAQTGQLAAWNSSLSPAGQAVSAASVAGADFTGLAIGASGGHNYLYAADFQNGKIDVFDGSFHQTTLAGSFADGSLPAGYAPFNVQLIGGQLYVTYAFQQNAGEEGGGSGASFFTPRSTGGIVDVYNTDGTFVKEFSTDSHLNAPWGLAMAPASFGTYANDLLAANFGDGKISAFDPSTGNYLGQLADTSGNPISIGGLRGLSFGNGATAGDANALFFTAEPGAASNPPESVAVALLDSSGQGALTAVGNGAVNVTGGGEIVVDSNNASAVVAIGNGRIAASEIDVTGTPGVSTLGGGSISGTIDAGVAPLSDPLASLPAPAVPSQTFSAVHAAGKDNISLQPGTYVGGIHVSGRATVTLQPGIYYLQGGGLAVTGLGKLLGNGVMIYDAAQGDDDGVSVTGRGSVSLSAMTSGTYRGIVLFESRGSNAPIRIAGNGFVNLTGTVYAAAATVNISGNGQLFVQGDAANGIVAQLVAGDLNVYGNGDFDLASSSVAGPNSGEHGLFGMLQTAGASPLAATSGNFSATEGQQFSGGVAAFTATSPSAAAGDFTASIDWGDGTTTSGTVAASGAGGFVVGGSHLYAEEGTQTVKVTIHDNSGNTITAQDAVTVADAPLFGSGAHFLSAPGQTRHGVVVGSFTDTGGAESLGNYSATIDWGDGTTSAGTIASLGGGAFSVSGSHVYGHPSTFVVTVAVSDEGGATTTIHSLAGNGHADDDGLFVSQAFEDILGRDADPAAEAAFTSLLQQGVPRSTITQVLTHSDEYYEDRIQLAYQDYLGRGADAGGLNFWLVLMRSGLSDEQLEAAFIGSAEFFNHSGGANRAWVDEMYFDLLGRAPDAAGEAYWENVLAHGSNRSQVAAGFAASAEREGATVQNDYLTFLGRQPSQSEVDGWVNDFHNGLSNEQVVAGFVASDEYFNQQTSED
ncbi:MAG TPA: TIGR03118 family protein [Pirellulales bacterium]|nr:TIGR03118 family protein [Pirellulales bacterium]